MGSWQKIKRRAAALFTDALLYALRRLLFSKMKKPGK